MGKITFEIEYMGKIAFEIEFDEELDYIPDSHDEKMVSSVGKVFLCKEKVTGGYQIILVEGINTYGDKPSARLLYFVLPTNAKKIDEMPNVHEDHSDIMEHLDTIERRIDDLSINLSQPKMYFQNPDRGVSEETLLELTRIISRREENLKD